MTGHEQGMVADVGTDVEEVDGLALSAEGVGQFGQKAQLLDVERAIVEDGPVDEVGHVAGVGPAEEVGLEGVRFLMVRVGEGA